MDNNVEQVLQKDNRRVYTGFFSDKDGNPDFWGLGPIFKGIFFLYILFIVISRLTPYAGYILFASALGKILDAIRFYYVNTLVKNGQDEYFVDMNVIECSVEGGLFLFVSLYLIFHSWIKKL